MRNKDRNFWKGLDEWEVMVMSETWMEEKEWGKIKKKLPKGYIWGTQWASRKSKKGRAIGGVIMGIRKEIAEKGGRIETGEEGVMVGRINKEGDRWRTIGVYAGEGTEKAIEGIERWMENREEGVRIIIGDFNARTGREGGRVGMGRTEEEGKEERKRKSRDEVMNEEGRKLVNFIGEMGWSIFNGDMRGEEEGEWTFTGGRGNTVIDYVIENEECREKVKRLGVGDKIDSDHHPIEVEVEGKRVEERRRGIEQNRVGRGVWNVEGRKRFREEIGRIERKGRGIEEEWEKMKEGLKEAMLETERGGKGGVEGERVVG